MSSYTWVIPQTPAELLQIYFRESSPQPIALSKHVHARAFWYFPCSSSSCQNTPNPPSLLPNAGGEKQNRKTMRTSPNLIAWRPNHRLSSSDYADAGEPGGSTGPPTPPRAGCLWWTSPRRAQSQQDSGGQQAVPPAALNWNRLQ